MPPSWFDKWRQKHPRVAAVLGFLELLGGIGGGVFVIWVLISGVNYFANAIGGPLFISIIILLISAALITFGLRLLISIFRQTRRETLKEHLEKIRANLVEYKTQLQMLADSETTTTIRTPLENRERVMSQLRAHYPQLKSLRPLALDVLLTHARLKNKRRLHLSEPIKDDKATINLNLRGRIQVIDNCLNIGEYERNKCEYCPPEK